MGRECLVEQEQVYVRLRKEHACAENALTGQDAPADEQHNCAFKGIRDVHTCAIAFYRQHVHWQIDPTTSHSCFQ